MLVRSLLQLVPATLKSRVRHVPRLGRGPVGPSAARGMDPVVLDYIRKHVRSPETFVAEIDERDEMFRYNLEHDHKGDRRRTAIEYYVIGSRIFDGVKQIADWHFGSIDKVGKYLEFASGYGRSTRFLVQELPPDRVWASDIYPDAVKFQKRRYGVNGLVSVADPARYTTDVRFDFIFASSFFSHMPESTFARWIEALHRLLTPRGILVFSTHDVSIFPPSVGPRPEGIWFHPASESGTLDTEQYGTTYVDEHFVAGAVDRATEGRARLHRIKRGLCTFQDIYIVGDAPNRDFSELDFRHEPTGRLDECCLADNGDLHLSGWAADINPGGSIKEIQVLSNDQPIERLTLSRERPDIAESFQVPSTSCGGWSCRVDRDRARPVDIIEVKLVNQLGKETVIFHEPPPGSPR